MESGEQVLIEEDVKDDEAATDKETPGKEKEENPGVKQDPPLSGDDERETDGEEEPVESPVDDPTVEDPPDSSSHEEEPPVDDPPGPSLPDDGTEPSLPDETLKILALQINELRTEYVKPKAEFIEFKILSSGNLGGVRVFVASNYKNPLLYEFAPVEVKTGEYVVLHLRTFDEAISVDEYGDDIAASGGTDSSVTARDFWIPGNAELLRKTDVVYVLDQDDNVMDAVLIAEKSDSVWPLLSKQDCFPATVEFLFNKGAWKSADGKTPVPADAVSSAKTTSTQTICRDEEVKDGNTAADWYITAKSSSTPGLQNNPKRL